MWRIHLKRSRNLLETIVEAEKSMLQDKSLIKIFQTKQLLVDVTMNY
jgi:hypothetical protein